jgi:hypothetical protein
MLLLPKLINVQPAWPCGKDLTIDIIFTGIRLTAFLLGSPEAHILLTWSFAQFNFEHGMVRIFPGRAGNVGEYATRITARNIKTRTSTFSWHVSLYFQN